MGRHSKKGHTEGEAYLDQYPALKRWINQCVACQVRGLKPELPETIREFRTFADGNLRRFFQLLPLDSLGRCELCAEYFNQRSPRNSETPVSFHIAENGSD